MAVVSQESTNPSNRSKKVLFPSSCVKFLQTSQVTVRVIKPTAQSKYGAEYANVDFDWKKIYSLLFAAAMDAKTR